jgi:hypothetical protein
MPTKASVSAAILMFAVASANCAEPSARLAVEGIEVAPCREPCAGEDLLKGMLEEIVSRADMIKKGKTLDKYEAVNSAISDVLESRIRENESALAEITEALVTTDDREGTHGLYCALVSYLARKNEGRRMTEALSVRCPKAMYRGAIEDYVVIVFSDELKDGTLVLCAAYEQAKNEDSKAALAAALRRGFRFIGPLADDKTLSTDVRAWYQANADQYEPNLRYLSHRILSGAYDYERSGLFVRKGVQAPERRTK